MGLIKTFGVQASLYKLESLQGTDKTIDTYCHALAHSMGNEAFRFYGSVAKALSLSSNVCASGYAHGVMEVSLSRLTKKELKTYLPQTCSSKAIKLHSLAHYNCVHGLGHGLMIYHDLDLFNSLTDCDLLKEDWESRSCYPGVFMQNIVALPMSHKSKYLKDDDPSYPCTVVLDRYKSACYINVTSHYLNVFGGDYQRAFSECAKSEEKWRNDCYFSMGRDISGRTTQDPLESFNICSLGEPKYRKFCFAGAAATFVYNDHSKTKAEKLCSLTMGDEKIGCHNAVKAVASSF